jgi:hypothetical protein
MMNPRIQELVEQSGISLYKKNVLDKHFPELYDSVYCESSAEQLEKFAELIVRECIKTYNDDGYQTEHEQDQRVLKHFGVES